MSSQPANATLNSSLVVISWWSNCLALKCLTRLLEHTTRRQIYVIQAGKSPEQKERFRSCVPDQIIELNYPENLPSEHSRIIQYLVNNLLGSEAGIWLVDHDVFFQVSLDDWLKAAEQYLAYGETLLCLPSREPGNPAHTSPMFWLSPHLWPAELRCIDPIPFQTRDESRRPDLFRSKMALVMPQKDTLMQAKEELEAMGLVKFYPVRTEPNQGDKTHKVINTMEPLPEHCHFGGLSLFTNDIPEDLYQQLGWFRLWMNETILKFIQFYATCPQEWLAIEDPVLIQRINEYQEFVHV